MDNLEDEGYTSPSEINYSDQLSKLPYKSSILKTQKSIIKPSTSSWDTLSFVYSQNRKPQNIQQQQYQNLTIPYLTDDNRERSSKIIDNLWLLSPEISGYHSHTTNFTTSNKTKINTTTTTTIDDIHSQTATDLKSKSILELTTIAEKPDYISLSEFIDFTVDLLCGKQSKVFPFQDDTSLTFHKNPTILIHGLTPGTLSSYCECPLVIGSIVWKLNRIQLPSSSQNRSDVRSSKIFLAFLDFVKDYIKVYQTVLMLKRPSILSLTMLKRFIHPFTLQLHMLMKIVQTDFHGSPITLLKRLNYFMLQNETPCLSEMLQNLFITCAEAYTKYVSEWIFHGSLAPTTEFHIIRNRIQISRDRRFWTHQFTQIEDVPLFLKQITTPIFETGKVINLLKELKHVRLPIGFNDEMKLEFHLSHSGIVKLMNTIENKMSQFLQENEYLLKEIEETVRRTATIEDFTCIDSAQLEENRKELEAQFKATQMENYLEKRKKKQDALLQVQIHLEEARNVRLRRVIDELFEEKKNREYWEEKEQKEFDEGYSMLREYYGEFMDTVEFKKSKTRSILPNPTFQHTPLVVEDISSSSQNIPEQPQKNLNGSGDSILIINSDKVPEKHKHEEQQQVQDNELQNNDTNKNLESSPTPLILNDDCHTESAILEEDKNSNNSEKDTTKTCKIEKLKSKDFKTRPIKSMKLDLDIFDKKLVPSLGIETSEQQFSCNEADEYLTHRFISQSIEISLMYRNKVVNLSLLHHIIVTKELFRHVKALQDFLLLQNGLFGYFLNTMLIDLVQKQRLKMKKDIMSNILTINSLLEEALSMVLDDEEANFVKNHLSFAVLEADGEDEKSLKKGSEKQRNRSISSEYEVLNGLYLRYTVDWPLNIIFSDEFSKRYESIFRLQMSLLRAETLLGKVTTLIKAKRGDSIQLKELNNYRYYFVHFVRSIRNYINVTVIHSSWTELTAVFCNMDSMEKIYELLRQYMKNVTSNCLLGPKGKPIIKLLLNQLIVIEAFCSSLESAAKDIDWNKGEEIPHQEYKHLVRLFNVYNELEILFVQFVHNLVEKGIYAKVSHFLDLLNFNEFFKLKT